MVDALDTGEPAGPPRSDAGGIDPLAAVVAQAELDAVSASRRASSDDIVAARLIGRVVEQAAEKVGVEYPDRGGLDAYLQRILAAAHRGKLDPVSYRVVWTLAHAPTRAAPRDETPAVPVQPGAPGQGISKSNGP